MKFFHKDIIIIVPKGIYYPREDSQLLANVLEDLDLDGKSVLDMGCGSGFLAVLASKLGGKVTAADISLEAVRQTEKNARTNGQSIRTIRSNLFENINEKYDIVVFNPPYLPETEYHDVTYSGGKTGRNIINRFIKEVKNYLRPNGKVYMVISSLTGKDEVKEAFWRSGLKPEIIKREKIEWEELVIIRAS
jgi:release factor glutamine methyltransferase